MDTKRLLTTMLLVGAVMLLWPYIFGKGNGAAPAKAPFILYTTTATQPAATQPAPLVQLGDPSKTSKDKLALWIDPATAGIDTVQLNINDYAETVKRDQPLTLFKSAPGLVKPFSTLSVQLWPGDATAGLLYDTLVWGITRTSDYQANLTVVLRNKGEPLAEVTKTIKIDPASYEVTISHAIKNLTDKPLKAQIEQLGPSDLPRDDPQADDRNFHGAILDVDKKFVDISNGFNATQLDIPKFENGTRSIGQFSNYAPGQKPELWVASSNRFFTTIVRPLPATPATATFPLANDKKLPIVTHIASANLDVQKYADKPSDAVGIVRFTGATLEVPAQTSVNSPLSVFMGPKKREVLEGSPTAAAGTLAYDYWLYEYKHGVINLAQGTCWLYSFCALDPIANAILWLLNFLHNTIAFGNYGVAIMILVIIVRAAMHPLTRASQINMAVMGKKMKDVAPEIEAAKKKYAGNKQKQNEELMRIYREKKVNPAGGVLGCLPMLIQMPIWAALWTGLRTDIDLRHATFIPGWINDLSHPDTILPSAIPDLHHPLFTIPLLGDIYGLNLLPLLLAVVFFFQMKVTTASQPKPADEQQAQMQKMSQYMIFLFPLFLYSAPSGLNLYIFASTMGGLIDTWLVRKTLKKRGILPSNAQTLPTHEENPLV